MTSCRLNQFYKLLMLAALCVVLIFSCSKENKPAPIQSTTQNPDLPNIKPKGNENYLKQNSDYIYNQDEVKTFELIIPNDNFSKLNFDPVNQDYVEAALIFEGDTISPIGVRYKGTIGAFAGCLSNPDWQNPSGVKTCEKLSLQIKINWKDRKERFFDLNKLQFHAQNYDKSQLRERTAYWLFAQMGVPAPRSVHARLVINKIYSGLYGLTEEIDNRFAQYFYKEGKGNVYKEVWPVKANGEPQTDDALIEALKTNEEEKNIDLIKEFGQAIVKANTSDMKGVVRKYMEIDRIMAYCVVDRAIRHDDGPFHWFCNNNDPVSCTNHNYYWFEDKKNRKMHLIPWDMDGAFEHVIANANDYTSLVDKWGETSNNCIPITRVLGGKKQRSAACEKLTAAWGSFDQEYDSIKKNLMNNFVTNNHIISQVDIWAKQIEPFIIEADNIHNSGITNEANKRTTTLRVWENATSTLKNQIKFIR